jgi:hypothetical protein
MSASHRWNEKHTIERTWTHIKYNFAADHRHHKQVQRESAATAGYHSTNTAVTHNEDTMAESTIWRIRQYCNSNRIILRCCGSSHTGQCPSGQESGGQLKRVVGTQGFTQDGTQ